MTWYVKSVGVAAAVAQKVKEDLSRQVCSEPEESMKNKVVEIVELAAKGFPSDSAILVEASGSQWTQPDGSAYPTLKVNIETLYGFVWAAPLPAGSETGLNQQSGNAPDVAPIGTVSLPEGAQAAPAA